MSNKILVADDSVSMRDLIKTIIEYDNGYEVQEASNGEEALHLLEQNAFDLLITDIEMPEINGIELIQRLRRAGSSMPVIVISGVSNQSVKKQLLTYEPIRIIKKPFAIDSLKNTVKYFLN